MSRAAFHVFPPSPLTSTLATFASPDHAAPNTVYGLPAATTSLSPGRAIAAFGWIGPTGTTTGIPPCRSKYEYSRVCQNPACGRSITTIRVSHFTDAIPYHPPTTARTGNPWLGVRSSPFIR